MLLLLLLYIKCIFFREKKKEWKKRKCCCYNRVLLIYIYSKRKCFFKGKKCNKMRENYGGIICKLEMDECAKDKRQKMEREQMDIHVNYIKITYLA